MQNQYKEGLVSQGSGAFVTGGVKPTNAASKQAANQPTFSQTYKHSDFTISMNAEPAGRSQSQKFVTPSVPI